MTHQRFDKHTSGESLVRSLPGINHIQIGLQTRIAIRPGQRKLVDILFLVEDKGEAQDIVTLVHGRSVEEHLPLGQPLPLGSTGALHQGSQSRGEEIPALADVNNVKEHSLILLYVVHGEVKPEAEARITRIRSKEQIVLEFAHQLRFSQVSRFEGRIKAEMAPLGLATLTRRTDDNPGNVAQTAFSVAVFAICKGISIRSIKTMN